MFMLMCLGYLCPCAWAFDGSMRCMAWCFAPATPCSAPSSAILSNNRCCPVLRRAQTSAPQRERALLYSLLCVKMHARDMRFAAHQTHLQLPHARAPGVDRADGAPFMRILYESNFIPYPTLPYPTIPYPE